MLLLVPRDWTRRKQVGRGGEVASGPGGGSWMVACVGPIVSGVPMLSQLVPERRAATRRVSTS
jgi:hypothetical protein